MTASPLIKFSSKDDFIAALEARRPFLRDLDKSRLADHKEAEKAYAADFREACKTAAKWTYAEAKEHNWRIPGTDRWGDRKSAPECPVMQEPRLDELLISLGLTAQKEFTVDSGNIWGNAHWILTFDPKIEAAKKVC